MSYSYLASPYTHAEHVVMERRYREAMRCVSWFLNQRIWVYSPIVHCHELARCHALPRDADHWWDYNKAMLEPAKDLLILALDGWQESKGIAKEVNFAHEAGKAVSFISPKSYNIVGKEQYA